MRLVNGNASLRCDYCKSVVIPKADDSGIQFLDEVVELTCPVCAASLWNAALASVQVNACKQCRGLLVKMGAIEALIEQMRAVHDDSVIPPPSDPGDLNRRVECPRCHQRMDTHFYYGGGHAVISGCERCEVNWLNGGVLMQIVRAPHESDAEAE